MNDITDLILIVAEFAGRGNTGFAQSLIKNCGLAIEKSPLLPRRQTAEGSRRQIKIEEKQRRRAG